MGEDLKKVVEDLAERMRRLEERPPVVIMPTPFYQPPPWNYQRFYHPFYQPGVYYSGGTASTPKGSYV